MTEKFSDLLQFTTQVSRLMVTEIRRRASNKSTGIAWGTGVGFSTSVRHDFQISQNTMGCHSQQLYRLRKWILSNENVLSFVSLDWEREEEKEVRGFLPELWRKLSSTNSNRWEREEWTELHGLLGEGGQEQGGMWTAAVSCLRCLLVVCCVTWIC